jgi:hypothetical protein
MRSAQCFVIATSLCVVVMSTTDAGAQPLGTFRWQFAPYCNTVTLDVEQRGAAYLLSGYDDRCGEAVRSAASGTAHLNADGSVSMGLTIVRPDGFTANTTAIINLATLSGTWQDSFGTDGTFLYNPAAPAGSPRPTTLRGTYAIDFIADNGFTDGLSAISFGHTLPAAPTAVNANFILGSAFTASCPGSLPIPQAAPGHLCVYQRASSNVESHCIVPSAQSYTCNAATSVGAAVYAEAVNAGRAYSVGSWAVTLPD